ncbi:hypothetical protein SAMN04488564_11777 [Lentzea waywayandensis]|uniref:Uncharacterized protein n=1 Tax=Lentzea waywayandensis TaxID=84724 RepID=A0A1I6FGS5_9PSEU|nr:hypothetical protein [Lentzea waywayandensis]SFR29153.1 hypothetical protein SAMN04488564_11777 [Lentzea waywayandensis]
MLDLSSLSNLPTTTGAAPWPGHEYAKGWGVFGLPFDSGHVLALRAFAESDFGPYRSIWHRDPGGDWSIYVDGPRLDAACPRYYGPACSRTAHARIEVTWTGKASLRVTMNTPALDWTLTARSTPILDVLNVLSGAMPLATWRPPLLVHARERMAQALGMGKLKMAGVMPSGHNGKLMPERMYLVDESRATLDGIDLGTPVRLKDNPTIGGVALPARGVLAIGQSTWEILDPVEHDRTQRQISGSTSPEGP